MQVERHEKWKYIVRLAADSSVAVPGMAASLNYFETYRRGRMPHNLVQVRNFFRTVCFCFEIVVYGLLECCKW
jgi:6-phosphogluconate dehydrogenase